MIKSRTTSTKVKQKNRIISAGMHNQRKNKNDGKEKKRKEKRNERNLQTENEFYQSGRGAVSRVEVRMVVYKIKRRIPNVVTRTTTTTTRDHFLLSSCSPFS